MDEIEINENTLIDFRYRLVQWFIAEKRDLPWRQTKDPYLIWLSEVILQQTRVNQGLPYYRAFANRFPNVKDLADADETEVLRLWQGLGYYSRARNLHQTARSVMNGLGGIFPNRYKDLIQLKGIGPYTAAAIASFASDEKVAVVDGNVYRVLARYFRIQTDINSSAGKKQFQSLADKLVPTIGAGDYNQAMMEIGAVICKPGVPDCLLCPLQEGCLSFGKLDVVAYPVKVKRIKVKERSLHFLVIAKPKCSAWLMRKRGNQDIWGGLYEFPLIEEDEIGTFPKSDDSSAVLLAEAVHKLTHQILTIKFWRVDYQSDDWEQQGFAFYNWEEINTLPKPIIIDKLLPLILK